MEYTHFDQNGNAVMVDVSDKIETKKPPLPEARSV